MMQALTYHFDLPRTLGILGTAWLVYATCQGDYILPAACFLIVLVTIKQVSKNQKKNQPLENKFSWATAMSVSLLLGWMWITVNPRQYESDFMQSYAIFILQSGSLFLVLFLWFSPRYLYRAFFLKLLPWLTVALSVNVAFTLASAVCFVLFCVVNAGAFMTQTGDTSNLPPRPKEALWRKIVLFTIFTVISVGLFAGFVLAFHIGDAVYTRLIKDYTLIYRRHPFFSFSPVMDIRGPGISGNDIRPVLEVDRANRASLYLHTQYFKDYNDGKWIAPEDVMRYALPEQHADGDETLALNMLVTLKDIVPVPRGTKNVVGYNGPYEQDRQGLVYSLQKSIHQVTISRHEEPRLVHNRVDDLNDYSYLNPEFKARLRPFLKQIVGNETDPGRMARLIQAHFLRNYTYSLDVSFEANEMGIIYILARRPPVYCSFFASTMAVLLRAADIPSRLTVGFLATERIGKAEEQFLVRVRDAHAWVEAYLPDPQHPGSFSWQRFDPTPPDRLRVLNDGRAINRIADAIYLAILRFRSDFKNLESEKLLVWLVMVLFVLVLIRNHREIWYFIRWCFSPNRKQLRRRKPVRKDYIKTYHDLELVLRKNFRTRQLMHETHSDLIRRLRTHHPGQDTLIDMIEDFFRLYQDNRFGDKQRPQLPDKLRAIKHASAGRN
ncbi:MAG: transglutaminase domain-containing protein [Candidatus Omnitrophica bacterium]|nr:transglutaminase domain-containing protein [Candidatus Omnitrophota bacterium]